MNDQVQQEDWSSLWKIHAPPKAKHLLWRICKGCIPTRTRLHERFVPCPLICPVCDQCNEDDWHVFFTCNDSIHARQAAGLEHVISTRLQQLRTTQEVIFNICKGEDRMIAGQFAVLLWTLWNNRNDKVWNESRTPGRSLGIKASQFWHEWFAIQKVQQQSPRAAQQQQFIKWEKPPMGWHKCNVDAGFYHNLHRTTAGWCLRDHQGSFVRAGTSWSNGNYYIAEGEAAAVLDAMKAVENQGVTHVIFETDSKSVVDAIYNFHGGSSEFSSIICNIKNALLSNPNFVVKFIKRQANMVAHTLARAAISWSNRCTFDLLPLCIMPLLNNEMI
ncbi:hypothetical protein TSUD_125560 [Trifolium subterraneum]|uniref:RNase H type-1 domain-containing protein n=1 Tax=Trifolium subterraneum TaxID=3900 RepID=A0A2Z6MU63_TRISU|nr:hypothetical protein TSUD_125560 [Trifolium subterraneum]